MKCINNNDSSSKLDYDISVLQATQTKTQLELKEQLYFTIENFSAAHFVTSLISKIEDNTELKKESIKFISNYIIQKTIIGKSTNFINKLVGSSINKLVSFVLSKYFIS